MKEILRRARVYRDGAHTRVVMGGAIGDCAYGGVYDAMQEDALRIANDDPEFALYIRAIFYRAAMRGAALASARRPLPGQSLPACW